MGKLDRAEGAIAGTGRAALIFPIPCVPFLVPIPGEVLREGDGAITGFALAESARLGCSCFTPG